MIFFPFFKKRLKIEEERLVKRFFAVENPVENVECFPRRENVENNYVNPKEKSRRAAKKYLEFSRSIC
ncbi:conserved protein of unknown function [Ruminococcaceae bacterium BL-6]|nr:conserved protein of unknown function [Ruminococcaceae bacterium BL-6]